MAHRTVAGGWLGMFLVAVLATVPAGCSVKKFAMGRVADALASGGDTYTRDDDPELVGEALPFSLKLMESLIDQTPRHQGLRVAAAQGFASYAYAYVHQPAEMQDAGLEVRDAAYVRARRLYARALANAITGMELSYPGFGEQLRRDPAAAVAPVRREHVPLLYWTAVPLGLAISLSADEAAMLGRLREVDAILARALALDDAWGDGALHELAITLTTARPAAAPGQDLRLRTHFDRAMALSRGRRPGVWVTFAENVLLPDQNARAFREALDAALAIDVLGTPKDRLVNLLAQRRAQWLLSRMDDLFLADASQPVSTPVDPDRERDH